MRFKQKESKWKCNMRGAVHIVLAQCHNYNWDYRNLQNHGNTLIIIDIVNNLRPWDHQNCKIERREGEINSNLSINLLNHESLAIPCNI